MNGMSHELAAIQEDKFHKNCLPENFFLFKPPQRNLTRRDGVMPNSLRPAISEDATGDIIFFGQGSVHSNLCSAVNPSVPKPPPSPNDIRDAIHRERTSMRRGDRRTASAGEI